MGKIILVDELIVVLVKLLVELLLDEVVRELELDEAGVDVLVDETVSNELLVV